MIPIPCLECKKTFTPRDSKTKFCSKNCSGSYNGRIRRHTEKTKEKIRSVLTYISNDSEKFRLAYKAKPCPVCSRDKTYEKRHRKTCSMECGRALLSRTNKGKAGGLIGDTSRRYISGSYKGIKCDSSWELAFVVKCLDEGCDVKRNEEFWWYKDAKGRRRKYYPDFIVDGVLYEIKGYMRENDALKAEAAPVVIIFGKSGIAPYLRHVRIRYGCTDDKLKLLYDEPRLNSMVCLQCREVFETHRSKATFCSRSCAGKFRMIAIHCE